MLPVRHRLRAPAEFASVTRVRGSARCAGRTIVVQVVGARGVADPADSSPSGPPAGSTRVGFIVSKAVGNAVTRNLVKRRLRELAWRRLADFPSGAQIVVRALPAAASASYADLAMDLDRAVDRLGARR